MHLVDHPMYFMIYTPSEPDPLPANPTPAQVKDYNEKLAVYNNFSAIIPPYDGRHPELSYYYLGAQPKLEINNDASKNIKGTIKMQFIQIQGIMLNSIIPAETQSAYNAIVSEES